MFKDINDVPIHPMKKCKNKTLVGYYYVTTEYRFVFVFTGYKKYQDKLPLKLNSHYRVVIDNHETFMHIILKPRKLIKDLKRVKGLFKLQRNGKNIAVLEGALRENMPYTEINYAYPLYYCRTAGEDLFGEYLIVADKADTFDINLEDE